MCLCMCDVGIVLFERTLTSHLSMGAFQFSSDTPAAIAGILWALRRVQWGEFATSAVFSSQILRLLDVPRAKDELRNIFFKKVLTFFLHVKKLSSTFFFKIEWSVDAETPRVSATSHINPFTKHFYYHTEAVFTRALNPWTFLDITPWHYVRTWMSGILRSRSEFTAASGRHVPGLLYALIRQLLCWIQNLWSPVGDCFM